MNSHEGHSKRRLLAGGVMLGALSFADIAQATNTPSITPFAGALSGGSGAGADAATGTARASYPLAIPPARGLQQPILSLGYAHTSRTISEVGAGWSLGLPVIERHAAAGGPPLFTAADVYSLSGARLVSLCVVAGTSCAASNGTIPMPAWSTGWTVYRPEVDSSYTRLFQKSDGQTWRLQKSSGEILEFGVPLLVPAATYETKGGQDYEASTNRVFRWKLVRQFEAYASGASPQNIILYSWRHWDTGDVSTLEDIYYTPPVQAAPDNPDAYAHHIHFRYQPNPRRDPRTRYVVVPPWLSEPNRLVAGIEVSSKLLGALREQVRRYWLTYVDIAGRATLANVVMEGRCASSVAETFYSDGRRNTWMLPATSSCPRATPGTSYTYTSGGSSQSDGYLGARDPVKIQFDTNIPRLSLQTLAMVDVNRDGLADFVQSSPARVYLNQGRLGEPAARPFSTASLAANGFDAFNKKGLTVFGGWDDVWGATWLHRDSTRTVTKTDGGPTAILQLTASGGGFQIVATPGNAISVMPPPHVLGDLDGDGSADAIYYDETVAPAVTAVRMSSRTLAAPTTIGRTEPLTSTLTSNLQLRPGTTAPHLAALADMDGDGIADYVTEADPLTPSMGLVFIPGRGKGQFGCLPSSAYCRTATKSPGYNAVTPASSLQEVPLFGYLPGSPEQPLDLKWDPTVVTQVQDLNGDGRAEIIQLYTLAGGNYRVDVWINVDGSSTSGWKMRVDRLSLPSSDFNLAGANPADGSVYRPSLLFGDVDGDGISDLVVCGDNECVYRSYSPFQPPGLLTHIDHESGATTDIDYHASLAEMELEQQRDPTTDPWPGSGAWSSHAPAAIWPVKSVRLSNNAPTPYSVFSQTFFRYRDPMFDPWAGALRGYGRVQATTGTHAVETQYYFEGCIRTDAAALAANGTCGDPSREGGLLSNAINGTPLSVEHLNPVTGIYHSTTAYHFLGAPAGDPGTTFVFPDYVDTYLYDTSNYAPSPVTVTHYSPTQKAFTFDVQAAAVKLRRRQQYDGYGNLKFAWDDGRVTTFNGAIDRPIRRAFNWQPTDTINAASVQAMGRQYRAVSEETCYAASDTDACGKDAPGALLSAAAGLDGPLRKVTNFYDSQARVTTSYSLLSGNLALQRQHASGLAIAPEPPNAAVSNSAIYVLNVTYDAYGNVNRYNGATTGECKTIDYDPTFADYATTSHTWLGASCTGTDLPTSVQVDRGLSLPIKQTEMTGAESGVDYDEFGRPKATWSKPSGATARTDTLHYAYSPFGTAVQWAQVTRVADGNASWSYWDAFGASLGTLTPADPSAGDGGNWIVHPAPARDPITGAPVEWFHSWFYTGAAEGFYPGTPVGGSIGGAAYDFMGRLVSRYRSSDYQTTEQRFYHELSTEVLDAENLAGAASHLGRSTTVKLDGHGRQIEVKKIAESSTMSTVSDYLATGELAVVERRENDAPLYRRWLRYDSLGRLVENAEPNATTNFADTPAAAVGLKAWRYAYDNAGRVVGTRDARGCGKNVFYDRAGRPVAEDYSPCLASQAPYTAYDSATGNNSEVFNVYDFPESGEPSSDYGGNLQALRGKLVSTRDRGAHSRFAYDGKGRVTQTGKRLAKPGTAAGALSSRYTAHWFYAGTHFDAVDRVDAINTGADVAQLTPGFSNTILYTYSARGVVSSVGGAYGSLVQSLQFDADGAPLATTYGDAKNASATFTYDADHRLQTATLLQTYAAFELPKPLLAQTFSYDLVGNVTAIADGRTASQWDDGAKPVSRTMTYDANYRLDSVSYDHGGDTQVSVYAPEEANSDARPLPRMHPPTRVLSQGFHYDALGNVDQAHDDVDSSFDRGLGVATLGSMGATTEPARKPNQLLYSDVPSTPSGVEAHYDAAGNLVDLAMERAGATCGAPTGKCSHRFLYDWDEVGQLVHARRWDYTTLAGEAFFPNAPTGPVAAELAYTYSGGARVLKRSVDAVSSANDRFAADIFGTLRLNEAAYSTATNDYERTSNTETVYLAGLGRAIYAPGLPVAPGGSDLHVFLQVGDHLGSTAAVIDQGTGDLVEYTTYLAYGATESDYRPSAWQSFREDFKFTGKEEDIEVGLTYFGARYYSPYLARFVSPDPATIHGLAADLNPYAYVSGGVFNRVDPIGLQEADGPSGQEQQVGNTSSGSDFVATVGRFIDGIARLFGGGHNSTPAYRAGGTFRPSPPPPPLAPPPLSFESFVQGVQTVSSWRIGGSGGNIVVGNVWKATWNEAVSAIQAGALVVGPTGWAAMALAPSTPSLKFELKTGPGEFSQHMPLAAGLAAGAAESGPALLKLARWGIARGSAAMAPAAADAILAAEKGAVSAAGELAAPAADATVAGDGSGLAQEGYQILDGVRRAKAAEMLGVEAIDAQIQVGNKIVGTVRVSPSQLTSPKTVIDLRGPVNMNRWLNIFKGTRAGEALPPITITPGTAGVPVPGVGFTF